MWAEQKANGYSRLVTDSDALTNYADKIYAGGWSLRSALVRYGQAEPTRSTILHRLMRRLDAALGAASEDDRTTLAPILLQFEALAGAMSTWANDRRSCDIPTPMVDATGAEAVAEFERLGVPEESIDPAEWRGSRSAEGRKPKAPTAPKEPKEPKEAKRAKEVKVPKTPDTPAST